MLRASALDLHNGNSIDKRQHGCIVKERSSLQVIRKRPSLLQNAADPMPARSCFAPEKRKDAGTDSSSSDERGKADYWSTLLQDLHIESSRIPWFPAPRGRVDLRCANAKGPMAKFVHHVEMCIRDRESIGLDA